MVPRKQACLSNTLGMAYWSLSSTYQHGLNIPLSTHVRKKTNNECVLFFMRLYIVITLSIIDTSLINGRMP